MTRPLMTGVDDAGNGSARRRRVDPERRAQLLKDVEELVLAEGFLALSMDDLAHRLHCPKATLCSVAGNKEQLVAALTKGFFRQATEQIEQAVADVADPTSRPGGGERGIPAAAWSPSIDQESDSLTSLSSSGSSSAGRPAAPRHTM